MAAMISFALNPCAANSPMASAACLAENGVSMPSLIACWRTASSSLPDNSPSTCTRDIAASKSPPNFAIASPAPTIGAVRPALSVRPAVVNFGPRSSNVLVMLDPMPLILSPMP